MYVFLYIYMLPLIVCFLYKYVTTHTKFAGSGVVHMVGGWSGLCGAIALGPRIYRFKNDKININDNNNNNNNNNNKNEENKEKNKESKLMEALESQHTLGNNVPFQVLGTFILWFGWYGFNAGSTLAANEAMDIASKAAVTSTLAAAGGGLVSATIGRVLEGYFSLPRVCNGILAGLVSITAGCSVTDTGDALAIGIIGAFVYYAASRFLERIHIDDPLDAWAVHGCAGAWGVISVGLFATPQNIEFAGYNEILINSTSGYRLSLQLFAVFIIIIWVVVWIGGLFTILKYLNKLRVSEEIERAGLDAQEHGGVAVDYKRGYTIKDKETARAMTVFGTGGATSDQQQEEEEEEEKEEQQQEQQQQSQQDQVKYLSSGTSQHKKLRPHATPHIKKFNPIPQDANDANVTELVPIKTDDS